MKATLTLASPALALMLLCVTSPANAQYAGIASPYLPGIGAGYLQPSGVAPGMAMGADPMQQMEQFAPLLEMMKKRMGKQRFGQLMQTVGPMMEQMMTNQGSAGGAYGGFGGQGFDPAQMATMMNPQMIMALVTAFEAAPRPSRTTRTRVHRERR